MEINMRALFLVCSLRDNNVITSKPTWKLKHNHFEVGAFIWDTVYCVLQGVIVSIDYCVSSHQFCSSSDDRSIRIWTCTAHDSTQHHWHRCVFIETRQLYGHMARVWKAKLLASGIVSISEVRLSIRWNFMLRSNRLFWQRISDIDFFELKTPSKLHV